MFSFFRKKKNGNLPDTGEEVPAWAAFFEKEEYRYFLECIYDYFRRKKIAIQMEDGIIRTEDESLGQMGLRNIAQLCRQIGKGEWSAAIGEHFDSLIDSYAFSREFEKYQNDYGYVRPYLGVRLYPASSVASIGVDNVIGDYFTDDIFRMLVYDFPQSVHNVQPSHPAVWNKSVEELLETGKNNIRQNYDFAIQAHSLGDVEVYFAEGEHFFVPNIVFDLENQPLLTGTHGALVGLPHRHAALFYPIEDMKVVTALNTLIPVVKGMYDEGPGALSKEVLYYRNGRFTPIPYRMEDNTLSITPPETFVEMLKYLGNE